MLGCAVAPAVAVLLGWVVYDGVAFSDQGLTHDAVFAFAIAKSRGAFMDLVTPMPRHERGPVNAMFWLAQQRCVLAAIAALSMVGQQAPRQRRRVRLPAGGADARTMLCLGNPATPVHCAQCARGVRHPWGGGCRSRNGNRHSGPTARDTSSWEYWDQAVGGRDTYPGRHGEFETSGSVQHGLRPPVARGLFRRGRKRWFRPRRRGAARRSDVYAFGDCHTGCDATGEGR